MPVLLPSLQMYMNGALVHAGNVFNGYSNTKKDFMKQVIINIIINMCNSDNPLPHHIPLD